MNFEDFRTRVLLVLRRKKDDDYSYQDGVRLLFHKNGFTVDEIHMGEGSYFKAKVSKFDYLSDSKDTSPRIRRDVVGRKIANEYVLLIDEAIDDKKYNYFEIYDKNFNVINKLWLGDFLYGLDNRYLIGIFETFKDDLSSSFVWKVEEEAKVYKKTLLKSVDK